MKPMANFAAALRQAKAAFYAMDKDDQEYVERVVLGSYRMSAWALGIMAELIERSDKARHP